MLAPNRAGSGGWISRAASKCDVASSNRPSNMWRRPDVDLVLRGLHRLAVRFRSPEFPEPFLGPRDPPGRPALPSRSHLGERRGIGLGLLEPGGEEGPAVVDPDVGIERELLSPSRRPGGRFDPPGTAPLADTSPINCLGSRPVSADTTARLVAITTASTPANRRAIIALRRTDLALEKSSTGPNTQGQTPGALGIRPKTRRHRIPFSHSRPALQPLTASIEMSRIGETSLESDDIPASPQGSRRLVADRFVSYLREIPHRATPTSARTPARCIGGRGSMISAARRNVGP